MLRGKVETTVFCTDLQYICFFLLKIPDKHSELRFLRREVPIFRYTQECARGGLRGIFPCRILRSLVSTSFFNS
jgi:hypothetical protein